MISKKIKAALVAAIAAVASYGVYTNQAKETMSDVMLANVEALAEYEGGNPSDCEVYCAPDETCTCIIKYHYSSDNVEHRTCPDHRSRS